MELQTSVQLIVYIIAFVFANLATYVIQRYHQNKPYGMQTILGRVIVIFVNVFRISCLTSTVSIFVVELLSPHSDLLSVILQIAGKFLKPCKTVINLRTSLNIIFRYHKLFHSLLGKPFSFNYKILVDLPLNISGLPFWRQFIVVDQSRTFHHSITQLLAWVFPVH